jgi:hypothetical protein
LPGKIVTRHRARLHRWSAAAFTRGLPLRHRFLFLLRVVPKETLHLAIHVIGGLLETIFKAEDSGKLITSYDV